MTEDRAFVLYSPAGESEIYRNDNLLSDSGGRLVFDGGIEIRPWLDTDYGRMTVPANGTPRQNYSMAVDKVAADFHDIHGKAVVCRQICGGFANFNLEAMAGKYFAGFEDMFCFAFYHPRYNYWMGASPELLVEAIDGQHARTRALAGTRPSSEHGAWDAKNLEEHTIVVKDICSRVSAIGDGWVAEPQPRGELPYGSIAHLCTPIIIQREGDGDFPLGNVVKAIHPTPAVGGFPRAKALEAIKTLESAPRYYYGGVFTIPGCAYVMLRCVHFDRTHWCIYSGSGVTGESNSADEWIETEAKAKPLVDLLNSF